MSPKMKTSNLSIVSWSAGMAATGRLGHVRPLLKHVGPRCTRSRRTPGPDPWPESGRPSRRTRRRNVPSMYSTRMPASTTVATADRWLFSMIFSSADRRDAHGVGVAALLRGPELERHLLRALLVVQGQLGLGDLPPILVEIRLHHAAAQADGVDRAGDPGHVVQQQPVGAIDAGHLHVAIGEVAPQAGAHADAVHHHAQLVGDVQRAAGRIVDAVGEQESRRSTSAGRKLLGGRAQGPHQRRGLARRRQRRQFLRPVAAASACSAKRDRAAGGNRLSACRTIFPACRRAWLKRVTPVASSAMLIEADVSSRKISAGFSASSFW